MNTVTRSRAKEILVQAGDYAEKHIGIRAGWNSCLDNVISPTERAEITAYWKTLPGHHSFSSALVKLAKGRK